MTRALAGFHPATREWFQTAFPGGPTPAQSRGWPHIRAGDSTLVFAPTGSGKTLAAFLAALDRLAFGAPVDAKARCRVVYVSPLRALAVDVERNLRAPLAGLARAAERRGDTLQPVEVGLRTGDTPAAERARLARRPPDILITTPESLYLVLTSQAREMLRSVEVVIVDEIHVLVGTKRGAHLALSLERLGELAGRPVQRIGLSATQRPLTEVARYLGGGQAGKRWKQRPVEIVDARSPKAFDVRVETPVESMPRPESAPTELPERGAFWPALHPRLLELVRAHRTTILFANSRRLAERLAAALNELAGEELVRAHHGSLAREQRLAIEEALKAGQLRALVATSSLELGIDMGAVDLVVQVETPPSVASAIQRIGRAGHQVGEPSRGILFPKYRGDLLSTAALTRALAEGKVEETRIPRNPLDVLAQQLVAICAGGTRTVDELFALVRGAAPFAELPRAQLEGVLDMLSGRYPSDEFAELRPRLVWDRLKGTVRAREGAQKLAVTNAGTIPDRGLYGVFLADAGEGGGKRVGELDEEMVFESRAGEVFVLGASSWRIVEIQRDRVLVVPAPGEPGKMPFWKGDRPPRPVELGAAVGRLTRTLAEASREDARTRLVEEHALTAGAADVLLDYLAEQKAACALPDDRTLVLERTRDEMGDWRLCLLSPWGGRVHAPWALVLQARLRAAGTDADTIWSDDGLIVRVPDREVPPDAHELLPAADEVEDSLVRELGGSALFASAFREAAGRALLLPRRRPGQRAPLWMQRKRAGDLLAVASRYGSFPMILEAYRECLQDVFDLPALVDLLRRIERRQLRVVTIDTPAPSPFAASLLFGYVANYIYEGDAPLAERRAQALTVDQAQLRELLGEAELRTLLDPDVIVEVELGLQGLVPGRRATSADRLHDVLVRVGDLSLPELAARVEAPAGDDAMALARPWLEALAAERRVFEFTRGGETRFAAAEDAGRLRDALGIPPPRGLPAVFLEGGADPLGSLVARHARTHGPFTIRDVAERLGVGESVIEPILQRLVEAERVVEGEFRPGGAGREWCDRQVLTTIRGRSLARLRRQVEPAPVEALSRLMLDWQGIAGASEAAPAPRSGPDALLDVIEQLQGTPVPATVLESEVLPARLPAYRLQDLDLLCGSGEVVWVGAGSLGERDGRVMLFLTDHLPLLLGPPAEPTGGALHAAIREYLQGHGASFFGDIQAAVGEALSRTVLDALWDLVWAGEATNDSMAALRAFARPAGRVPTRRMPSGPGFRSRRHASPSAVGRWSLVPAARRTSTERARAVAEQLLARHGVLTRAAVLAEAVPGGFTALYPVLKALEEAGRVRRGYFVAGLGGSQFARPGALDRLRALREPSPDGSPRGVVLAATDPASPWGATLPWPSHAEGRATRTAGAHVVLVDGVLAAWIARGQRDLLAFLPEDEPARAATARALSAALARWFALGPRQALGWDTEGDPLTASALAPFLREAGFVASGPGFRLPLARPAPPSTEEPVPVDDEEPLDA